MAIALQPDLSTRDRLLDAALSVCAQRGWRGASTREIAEVAQVNEVTLFRQFGNKHKLLGALVQRALSAHLVATNEAGLLENDLRTDLAHFAETIDRLLTAHEPLIRALIGESHQHPEEARQVICEASKPLSERLRAYLRAAQKAGAVRRDVALEPAVDCFTGMLLAGMLRRTGGKKLGYGNREFIETSVDLFVRGIAAPAFSR